MKRKHWIVLAAIAAIVAGGGFLIGRQSAGESASADTMARWLNLTASQAREIREDDADYVKESASLRDKLQTERRSLADLVEDGTSSAQAIDEQLDRVLSADAALQKRVMAHVIRVRGRLDASQRRQLMSLCAQEIRGAGQGAHHGHGAGDGTGPWAGRGMGRGPGGGHGHGAGHNQEN